GGPAPGPRLRARAAGDAQPLACGEQAHVARSRELARFLERHRAGWPVVVLVRPAAAQDAEGFLARCAARGKAARPLATGHLELVDEQRDRGVAADGQPLA